MSCDICRVTVWQVKQMLCTYYFFVNCHIEDWKLLESAWIKWYVFGKVCKLRERKWKSRFKLEILFHEVFHEMLDCGHVLELIFLLVLEDFIHGGPTVSRVFFIFWAGAQTEPRIFFVKKGQRFRRVGRPGQVQV